MLGELAQPLVKGNNIGVQVHEQKAGIGVIKNSPDAHFRLAQRFFG